MDVDYDNDPSYATWQLVATIVKIPLGILFRICQEYLLKGQFLKITLDTESLNEDYDKLVQMATEADTLQLQAGMSMQERSLSLNQMGYRVNP